MSRAISQDKNLVKDVMIRKVVTTTPNESIEVARRKMTQKGINSLPVIDNNNLVLGIVTSEDIMAHDSKVGQNREAKK
jgi:CBS domain-containing protein